MSNMIRFFNISELSQNTNDIDGQNPLLLSVNKTEYVASENNPTHSHKYLEFLYILDGEGEFITGERHIPLKKHDILAVNAGVIHVQRCKSSEKPLSFYSLLFDNLRIKGLKENCIGKNDFIYQKFADENNLFFSYITHILEEVSNKKNGCYLCLKGIVYQFFISLCRIVNDGDLSAQTKISPTIRAAKEYIDNHYAEDISLSELAKSTYSDKYYLAHQFKKAYNVSPMHYLTIVRLNHAAQMLASTDLSVTEIASLIGYDNPIYFSEQFKKYIGTTPSIYRKITSNEEIPSLY